MRTTIKLALAAIALAVGLPAASLPAAADGVSVSVGGSGIAFGYSDGYWDRDHHWHAWRDQNEAAQYRTANSEHYYDRKHDADADKGWHDKNRWWDKH